MVDSSAAHPWRDAAPVETKRLVLRAMAFEDVPRIVRYAGDITVSRMLAMVPHPYTEAHGSAFVGDVLASNAEGGGLALAIARRKEPGALIGSISFSRQGDAAEIGWWLGRPYWGKGFATEAVRAMIAIAFRDPSLAALTAGAFAENAASLHLQKKLGFVETGRREHLSLARGGPVPHIDTLLTRDAFAALSGPRGGAMEGR